MRRVTISLRRVKVSSCFVMVSLCFVKVSLYRVMVTLYFVMVSLCFFILSLCSKCEIDIYLASMPSRPKEIDTQEPMIDIYQSIQAFCDHIKVFKTKKMCCKIKKIGT